MDTVVITLFLITKFYICKMDADYKEQRSARISSQRDLRWSMNSQRLEEIVAELMRPIIDIRQSFDTDLSGLLEEYLTEAGLRALAEDQAEGPNEDGSPREVVIPNFTELALVLQHSTSVYGRKVDYLYQHVMTVSDSLGNSIEIANDADAPNAANNQPATPSTSRRRPSVSFRDFAEIVLEPSPSAIRELTTSRPPPTLSRVYIELEPRIMADSDIPLRDYVNEPIGLLADFQVGWRLQNGVLVEELATAEMSGVASSSLRPIPLMELQAAIEANAPPPPVCSTPLPDTPPPEELATPDVTTIMECPPPQAMVKRSRKRRSDLADIWPETINLTISAKLKRKLSKRIEFSIPGAWIRSEIRSRSLTLLNIRRRLRQEEREFTEFQGWTMEEILAETNLPCLRFDSDDDGFFERSSMGDSDGSRGDDMQQVSPRDSLDWTAWQAGVVARANEAEARGGFDVKDLGRSLLATLPPSTEETPFTSMLKERVKEPCDVSRTFLATLFLANAGNVEIVQGAPLSLDSFSVRLVNPDGRLLDAQFAPGPAAPAAPAAAAAVAEDNAADDDDDAGDDDAAEDDDADDDDTEDDQALR